MTDLIFNIIGVSWLVYNLNSFIDEFNIILKNFKKVVLIPKKIVSCLMCTSFWVCLVITKDVSLSSSVSLLAYLVDKYLISTDIKL
tara:strand:+ start:865 stop:1122 length:258 start_codon:yes stop_codon:yes gene_type:complete